MGTRCSVLSIVALVGFANATGADGMTLPCLPHGISPTDVVSTIAVPSASGQREIRKVTVEQNLAQIKARCRKGKLVDSSGVEIRFYRVAGCRGVDLPEDRTAFEKQARELAALKKRYRVIQLTCNTTGEPIPRSRPDGVICLVL